MKKKVTFKNKPVTLVGRNIKINEIGFDFRVASNDLTENSLANFKDKIKLITFFPSLDTGVCDLQVKEFNKKASLLSSDVVVLGISKDLPFAQKRFCDSFKISNIKLFSDYKTSSFGINYGVLIKELGLLARGAVILDKNNVIRYIQIVDEITNSIDYDSLLKSLSEIVKSPNISIKDKILTRCRACEEGTSALKKDDILKNIKLLNQWEIIEDKKIVKEFKFKDFIEAKYFLDLIAAIADEQNHHPTLIINYNKLKVILTTHFVNGLTDNDFIMAKIIDQLI